APDKLASWLGGSAPDHATVFAEVMHAIANDGPSVTRATATGLAIPTLVIGSGIDLIHPLATARELAETIPGAVFAEVTPKAVDKDRHFTEIRAAIGGFLDRNFNNQDQS
ncbi:alpha/beta fold hydrolase, partial [Mesorhizobium australicum]|uniref:alpha/beta fold hydrolase n=1 Tax=Mesorhizobium australicum TaxID=536018 RepID=UPI0033492046